MNFCSVDADITNVRKRLARLYSIQQVMRFGLDAGWTQYFERPMRHIPFAFSCCERLGYERRRIVTTYPRYSAMQEMKL